MGTFRITINMKTVKLFFLYLYADSVNSFEFNSEFDDAGCSSSQECRTASECPSAVREFKQGNVQPKICRLLARSVMICCDGGEERDREDTPPPRDTQCGQEITRRVFNFKLQARQALLSTSFTGQRSELSLDVVRIGAHDLSVEEEAAEDFTVQRVVIHLGLFMDHPSNLLDTWS